MLLNKSIMQETKKVEVQTSKQFTVNLPDIAKSLLISGITSALLILYPIISSGRMPISDEWKQIGIAAISACLSYLIKNFFTASQTVIKIQPPDKLIAAE